jgi:tRNA dimethylallyltransferase
MTEVALQHLQKPLLVIVGPTGVGKSDLAVEIALLLNGEVISADSMQIYKLMDIGTAKITRDEMHGVPHHLLSVVWPDQEFTVADYVNLADEAIKEVCERNRVPIVVGGTGLYVKALLEDYLFPDSGADWEFRKNMSSYAAEHGAEALHRRLADIDPITAERLHPNDIRRIIRALEVYENSGKPLSQQISRADITSRRYKSLQIGLNGPRELLYNRINSRVDEMLKMGLLDEVQALLAGGYANSIISMQALGYKELIGYFNGDYDFSAAIELLKRDTRRYAKRQLSWFRRDKEVIWYDRTDYSDLQTLASKIAVLYKECAGTNIYPDEF